jgi:hypothetical protein
MTIADRNRILASCLFVEAAVVAAYAVSVVLSLGLPRAELARLASSPEFPWEPALLPALPAYLRVLAACGALGIYSLATGFWILRAFRKTPSYEILFFAVFACSVGIEAARSFAVWLIGSDAPIQLPPLVTRLVYFGRWTGALSLFTASLYSVGFEYEKTDWAIGIVLFLSAILATIIPINSEKLMNDFTYRIGYSTILGLAYISASALSLLNFFFAAYLKGSRDYVWMGSGLLLAMLGRDAFFHFTDIAIVSGGFLLLAGGTYIFTRRCFRRALWQ